MSKKQAVNVAESQGQVPGGSEPFAKARVDWQSVLHQFTERKTVKEGEAGRYLGISVSQLRHWRSCGGGPSFVKVGRAVLYRISDLESFLQKNTVVR